MPPPAVATANQSGHVMTLLVKPDGMVERIELVSATPPQMYDQDMQKTFEKWTFRSNRVARSMHRFSALYPTEDGFRLLPAHDRERPRRL